MPGLFGDNFLSLLSPSALAQYRATPVATLPNAPAPGPLSIPSAQPPVFLSPPNQASAAPAPPVSTLGNIGQSLANGINNHALTLMALGAGIAQGGVGQGLASAATAAQAERNRQAQQLNFLQTYNALTDAGVPAEVARAAVINPSLMRALAVKYLGPRGQSGATGAAAASASSATSNPNSTVANASSYQSPPYQRGAEQSAAFRGSGFPPTAPTLPAAISPNAPVKNLPVTPSRLPSFADMMNDFYWRRMLLDPRPMDSTPILKFADPDTQPDSGMFDSTPLNPPGGSPMLPPEFR